MERTGNIENFYQKKIDVAVSDREFYNMVISAILILGLFVSDIGFKKWIQHVQPTHDAILKLEKEKLELEVASLRLQAGSTPSDNGENNTAS